MDNITGTGGNDTIIADNTGTPPQLSAADQIDGGAGTDTLKIYQASTTGLENTSFGTLSNVENIYINNGKLTTTKTLDVSGLTGVTSIALDSPQAMADSDVFTLKTASGQTVSLTKVVGTTGGATSTFNLNGASDVTLNGVGTDLTLDLVSTGTALKLTTSGAASTFTLANTGAKLATLTIAGDKDLTITESLTTLKTIDASAATGKVKVDMSGAASDFDLKFTGGSGNDTLVFKAAHLTKTDTIDGGNGTDTVVINDTAPVYTGINAMKNVEVLGVGSTTGATTVDIAQITNGINQFLVSKALGQNVTFNNALSTSTFTIDNSGGQTATVTIANKVGETATTVTIDNQGGGAQTLAVLTIAGATTVTLTSSGKTSSDTNTITTFTNGDNSNITVKGNADLTFGLSAVATGSKVDASAFTGALNVTGSTKADVLIGGSGNDTIKGGDGEDDMTGGAGNDTFVFAAGDLSTTPSTTVFDIIRDFGPGDKIDFGAINITVDAGTGTGLTVNAKGLVSGATSLSDFITKLGSSSTATAGSALIYSDGTDSYLFISDGTAGLGANDVLVKLVGVALSGTQGFTITGGDITAIG